MHTNSEVQRLELKFWTYIFVIGKTSFSYRNIIGAWLFLAEKIA